MYRFIYFLNSLKYFFSAKQFRMYKGVINGQLRRTDKSGILLKSSQSDLRLLQNLALHQLGNVILDLFRHSLPNPAHLIPDNNEIRIVAVDQIDDSDAQIAHIGAEFTVYHLILLLCRLYQILKLQKRRKP